MAELEDYESLPHSTVATNLMAGALAGITEHTVMYPFDSIKVRNLVHFLNFAFEQ